MARSSGVRQVVIDGDHSKVFNRLVVDAVELRLYEAHKTVHRDTHLGVVVEELFSPGAAALLDIRKAESLRTKQKRASAVDVAVGAPFLARSRAGGAVHQVGFMDDRAIDGHG